MDIDAVDYRNIAPGVLRPDVQKEVIESLSTNVPIENVTKYPDVMEDLNQEVERKRGWPLGRKRK